MKRDGRATVAHFLLLVSVVWATRLPLILSPWLVVVPVETVLAINIPVAEVTEALKLMVPAIMAVEPEVGAKEAVLIVTVPEVIKTTLRLSNLALLVSFIVTVSLSAEFQT